MSTCPGAPSTLDLVIRWLERFTAQKIKDGVRGDALILTIEPWDDRYGALLLEMRLQITVPPEAPYIVKQKFTVLKEKYPSAGLTLPVTVERNHPERVRIEWDEVPTNSERLDVQYGTKPEPTFKEMVRKKVAERRRDEMLGPPKDDLLRPAAPMDLTFDADPSVRLKKLATLRDAGIVSAADFEEQKQRILREI